MGSQREDQNIFSTFDVRLKWKKRHVLIQASVIVHHRTRKTDEMPGVRDFLRRAKKRIRNRSEDPSGVGLPVTPRPTESAPDLRINTSALPSTSRSPESNDVRAVSSQTTHLEIENPSGVGLSVPRPTESTPDLQIGTSTLSLTTRGPKSNGMYTALLRRSA